MTEPDNPDWHAALDRAVPEPSVPADLLDRVDSAVRGARRRRRWAAGGTAVVAAAVVVVVAAATLPPSGGHHAVPAHGADSSLSSRTAAPSITPSASTSAAPSSAVSAAPHDAPCTSGDNPEKEQGLQPLPATFVPTQAYECHQDLRTYPGDGTWQVLLGQRLDGDLSTLVAALRKPSVPLGQVPTTVPSGAQFACAGDLELPPTLILFDAAGDVVRPRVPVDGCNQPQAGVGKAVRALAVTTVQVIKLQQTQTQSQVDGQSSATAVGCDAGQFKDLLVFPGTDKLSQGGPIAWHGSVRLCLYTDDAKEPDVGTFVHGRKLSPAEVTTLQSATDLPGTAKPCTAKHTQFLVVFDKASYTTIEVGACSRVQRPDDGLGAGDPTAIAALVKSLSG